MDYPASNETTIKAYEGWTGVRDKNLCPGENGKAGSSDPVP
jgi:hypothetical protein